MILTGRAWVFGDKLGATDILPQRFDKEAMRREWDSCKLHLLEDLDPAIAGSLQPGDLFIGGTGFGHGHAHYYGGAVGACIAAGVGGFLVEGISGMFQRASIDSGLPAWVVPGITGLAAQGERLELDLAAGRARNLAGGRELAFPPVAPVVIEILAAKGTQQWALDRVQRRRAA